jgi:hypothetical protein
LLNHAKAGAASTVQRRLLGACLIAAALAAGCVASSARAASQIPATEDVELQQAAVASYGTQNDVSAAVAAARIQLQDETAAVADEATAELASDAYAGMWYDPGSDGRLTIALAVAPEQLTAAAQRAQAVFDDHGVGGDVAFVAAGSSWSELVAAQREMGDRLESLFKAGLVDALIDATRNAVVIETAATLTRDQSDLVAEAVASAGVSVKVEATDAADREATPAACAFTAGAASSHELSCDPQLRGGPMIESVVGGTTWSCTAGFVVADAVFSGTWGLLTAGHCMADSPSNPWTTRFANGSTHTIGSMATYRFGTNGDYGLTSVSNPSGWSLSGGHTYVWVAGVPGQTTQDSFYQINQAGHAVQGQTICSTSGLPYPTGYHTACGAVTGLNVQVNYGGTVVYGLGRSNACAGVQGSSGGPFYKDHTGYGLMSGFDSACVVYYQGLSGALSGTATQIY